MRMERLVTLLTLAGFLAMDLVAQRIATPAEFVCPEGPGPVRSTILHSDSACTSFLLCIDTRVRPHLHRMHTEHVFVLEGTAVMTLGDSVRTISSGDVVLIPPGTPHAVSVTGGTALKVISVQSPWFDGSDRVFLDTLGAVGPTPRK